MKKITIVSIFSFLFLILSSLSAYFTKYLEITNPWIPLIIGVIILTISGIYTIFFRDKISNIVCFTVNSIALGFCIRAWYIYREIDNSLLTMVIVSLICILYLWFFYLLLYIPAFNRNYEGFLIIFLILSIIAYIPLVIFTKTTYLSTIGYYTIIEMAFIFAMSSNDKTVGDLIRSIEVSTYSVFIVAIIIALIMLSEGNIDGFDLSIGGENGELVSPRNKKVREDIL